MQTECHIKSDSALRDLNECQRWIVTHRLGQRKQVSTRKKGVIDSIRGMMTPSLNMATQT